MKKIVQDQEAVKLIKEGADELANSIRGTIGPKGHNIILDSDHGSPDIVNDAETILREAQTDNRTKNLGYRFLIGIAHKVNNLVGEGRKSAVLMGHSIFTEGLKQVSFGADLGEVLAGIEFATKEIMATIDKMAKKVKTKDEIIQVATMSSESMELGKIIADTIYKVGANGVVTVEESPSFEVESEVVEGMQFDKGYISPYFVNNLETMEAEYENMPVLLINQKISSLNDFGLFLKNYTGLGHKDLAIVADDFDDDVLGFLVSLKVQGGFRLVAVKSPSFSDNRSDILEDIGVLTGAQVITPESGIKFSDIGLEMLGQTKRIIVTKDKTTIIGGKGKKSDIETRVKLIQKRLENCPEYEKDKLRERLGKLTGGIAVIKVGAVSDKQMKYQKLKIKDAVEASKLALKSGIVAGSGIALIQAKNAFRGHFEPNTRSPQFNLGVAVVLKAIESPFRGILANAGHDDASVIIDKIKKGDGYCVKTDEFVADIFKAGIIDSAEVVTTGLRVASSEASIHLTIGDAFINVKEKQEKYDY